ncbi:DUF362 domain-containing protein [Archaeoglobus veneficus]|uniref:4Fe-4S ferredoxin iron-sulfur binding domain-containing protein n=1 Tax=Archaeoglobus veneficus (strain DSM 11195 / SNP6) TaxID=693661 RepID=F2KN00_ARCVS|nr:DUF362 domain-containing protein [Archaeoglobus veneficus]AEA47276.1 4Fe-4S ferredoxin iron-sulfur binding domain-containing protein [Archaeoglobus veneficus SNP6]
MDVYFSDARASVKKPEEWYQPHLSPVKKLEKLIEESGVLDFVDKGDIIAVKTHFGDRGTTRTLRSVFIRKIVEAVKDRGGKPFVTETTGLGMTKDRSTAVGRLLIAEENGYTSQTVGAPIIIADGMLGLDCVTVDINGVHLKKVHVAKAIAECDGVVCATHFKLHMQAGIGGSIKNVGVGCVAKPSKFDIHCPEKPVINEKCDGCGRCTEICPINAISCHVAGDTGNRTIYTIDRNKCIGCTGCYEVCRKRAIDVEWLTGREISERIAECALGVVRVVGKDNFGFINFAMDITPHCDCRPYSDMPAFPDIGIFASRDIVAVDKACIDALLKARPNPGALVDDFWEWTEPMAQIEHAEKLGIGISNYTLEIVE